MATLNLKSITTMVADQAAAIQTKASALIDFSTGSVLRAVVEANAAIGAWLQAMAIQILSVTRLSSSTGTDVDSFVADWGLTRLGASGATGNVTFSRFTPTAPSTIPVNALVRTADGTQSFAVLADATNTSWVASLNAYILPAGVASITVPVQAITSGAASNVAPGAISSLVSNISGIDTVANALAFTGGVNAESDGALKSRFVAYIGSLSKATVPAILYTVNSMQLGLQATVMENVNIDGSARPGYLAITIDDGSGAPSSALIAQVAATIGTNARAAGIMWGVFPPSLIGASLAITTVTATGFDHNTVVAAVSAAVQKYMASLTLGVSLPITKLAQIVYEASPGVANATISINNASSDIVAKPNNRIVLTSITVT